MGHADSLARPPAGSVWLRRCGQAELAVANAAFAMAPTPPAAPGVSEVAATSGAHRRIALCIGIDNYPTAQLFGCRNDADLWQSGGRRVTFRLLRAPGNRVGVHRAVARHRCARGHARAAPSVQHGPTLCRVDGNDPRRLRVVGCPWPTAARSGPCPSAGLRPALTRPQVVACRLKTIFMFAHNACSKPASSGMTPCTVSHRSAENRPLRALLEASKAPRKRRLIVTPAPGPPSRRARLRRCASDQTRPPQVRRRACRTSPRVRCRC